ncbi:MAG TPA: class I SAM-dependent methyltransferase [Terriglobales bacterium]|nr:class I SAM-dependent methyltransferase [Terriglobales bacterium]
MKRFPPAKPRIFSAAHRYWAGVASRRGPVAATYDLLAGVWEFLRNSTPARLRQRYGDADYDWDHRVNTTSAAVGWRDRLLGIFHSPYQPTEPALFGEMLDAIQQATNLNFADFAFVDLGSGKGRTLLMASDYPFRRIVGVEVIPSLHRISEENLSRYKSDSQRCFSFQCFCADATSFPLPEEPLLIYLFNPFPEAGLRQALGNFRESFHQHPRPVYILYHNPQLEALFTAEGHFKKIAGTHQYSVFGMVN